MVRHRTWGVTMPKSVTFSLIIALAAAISTRSNSAGRYQPIVDGPCNATYAMDLSTCQDVAGQRSYANGDVKSNTLL